MASIVIDNTQDTDMLLAVSDRPEVSSPEFDYESDYVDGRDGSLNRLKYIKDVEQKVSFNILENFNIKSQLRFIKSWLFNCKEFYFTDDFVYRKVKYTKIGDIKNEIADYGEFDVTFVCDPFEYSLDEPKITVSQKAEINNKGTYYSLPTIRMLGKGRGTLTINDSIIQLDLKESDVIIDSASQEIYKGDTNFGLSMIGEFPRFEPGFNAVSVSGFEGIEIQIGERYL